MSSPIVTAALNGVEAATIPAPIAPQLALFDTLPDAAHVRLPVVTALFHIGPAHRLALVKVWPPACPGQARPDGDGLERRRAAPRDGRGIQGGVVIGWPYTPATAPLRRAWPRLCVPASLLIALHRWAPLALRLLG